VAAATNLPLFLFALPAGALADIVDRRRLLILAQVFMMLLTLLLLALTVSASFPRSAKRSGGTGRGWSLAMRWRRSPSIRRCW
jgi:MFS family permease